MGYRGYEYVTINIDLEVLVIDSVWKMEIKPDGSDVIENSERLTTGMTKYKWLESGKFEKIK